MCNSKRFGLEPLCVVEVVSDTNSRLFIGLTSYLCVRLEKELPSGGFDWWLRGDSAVSVQTALNQTCHKFPDLTRHLLAGADERPITYRLFFRIPIRIWDALTRRSLLVYETDENDQCVLCHRFTGVKSRLLCGVPKQLGPFCSKHQPRLDILTANNQYDEAHILE